MPKNRKKNSYRGLKKGLILLALIGFPLLIAALLQGHNIALFNPKGVIAEEQLRLILLSVGIMLAIAVPTLAFLYFTAWRYRESNEHVKREAAPRHSLLLNISMWLVPSAFAIGLSLVMWPATHRLEPKKHIAADAKPITIQVVAQRWKWLFIYPEQKIATVNFVQIPKDTPVTFELTADEAPMSSFWIPNLGGMLYAMNGHVNRLNLLGEIPGDYPGSSAEINGAGFAGMKFTARVSSSKEFDTWTSKARLSRQALDTTEYNRLLKPSENNPVIVYSAVENGLYDKVLMKYMGAHEMHIEGHKAHH